MEVDTWKGKDWIVQYMTVDKVIKSLSRDDAEALRSFDRFTSSSRQQSS